MGVIFLPGLGIPVSFRRVGGLNDLGEKACVGTTVLGMKGETEGHPFWPHHVFNSAFTDEEGYGHVRCWPQGERWANTRRAERRTGRLVLGWLGTVEGEECGEAAFGAR